MAAQCLLKAFDLIRVSKELEDVIKARDLLTEYINIYQGIALTKANDTDYLEDADKIMAMEAAEAKVKKAAKKAAKKKAAPKPRKKKVTADGKYKCFTDAMLEKMQFLLIEDKENGTNKWTPEALAEHFNVTVRSVNTKINQLKNEGSL